MTTRARRHRPASSYVGQAADLYAITESQFQTSVIRLARDLGWGITGSARKRELEEVAGYGVDASPLDGLIYHPRYSLGSEPGWPDLVLIRRKDQRMVFAELKAEKGRLSDRQVEVLDLLRSLFVDAVGPPFLSVHVWRPSDLATGSIAEVLR